MFGLFKKKAAPENPNEFLRFFQSVHKIDDAYLADLLGQKATGEIAKDIAKMCEVVEIAIMPIQAQAQLSGGPGDPRDIKKLGYVFGWLDFYKNNFWGVTDFNRSFFHYGFSLYFSDLRSGGGLNFQAAKSAMICLLHETQDPSSEWKAGYSQATEDAVAFLEKKKIPKGPHRI